MSFLWWKMSQTYWLWRSSENSNFILNILPLSLSFFVYTWYIQKVSRHFCTGISNCCRLLKIYYVIAIHLMTWLTNVFNFRFKWTATAAIGIHPTKSWLSQLVNFKNAIWTLEERFAIKFILNLEKMPCDESWIYCYNPETKRVPSGSMLALSDPRRPDRANPPTNFDHPFFWQHWHDLHALGSHWTDS